MPRSSATKSPKKVTPKKAGAEKRGPGRKPLYEPEMCERVREYGAAGKSRAQMAAKLGVSRKTIYEWIKVHPDFNEAMEDAVDLALAWWEDKGQAGLDAGAGNFNATAFIFQMKNRFRSDYRDQQDHEHGVTDTLGALLARIDAGPRGIPTRS